MTSILKLDLVIVNMYQYAETKFLSQEVQNNNSKQSENDDWNTLMLNTSKYILHEASIYSVIETRYAHHAAYSISRLHKRIHSHRK